MKRLVRWLFSWRTARRALIGVAVLVTLYALYCTEENVRGKRAWNKYRRELEASGAQLDFAAFIPKPVPDEENFAATPVIKSWFRKENMPASDKLWNDNYSRAAARVGVDNGRHVMDLAAWAMAFDDANPRWSMEPGKLEGRRMADLTAWGMAFEDTSPIQGTEPGELEGRRVTDVAAGRMPGDDTNSIPRIEPGKLDLESRADAAPSVLEELSTNETIFAQLRAASQRPYSRYTVEYNVDYPYAILLPHLGSMRAVCRRLGLKACAELAEGRRQDALEDIKLALYVADSVKEEPFIISYLVRIACLQSAIQPIWEGLAEHAWSDAQLQEIQTRLQSYNFIADLRRPYDGERAGGVASIDLGRKQGLGALVDLIGNGQPTGSDRAAANFLGKIVPQGWFYQEQVNYCRLFGLQIAATFDGSSKRVYPSRVQSNARELGQAFGRRNPFSVIFLRHQLMSMMLLPALERFPLRGAIAQTTADQAALACALERYRLANGRFPDTLDALVPQFISQLPHDVITGEPYKYRRTADRQFVLYSVGWNEKDDGGVPGKTLFDEKEGDWVWQYPEPTIVR